MVGHNRPVEDYPGVGVVGGSDPGVEDDPGVLSEKIYLRMISNLGL